MNTNSVNQSPFPAPARFRLNLLKALWFIPGLFNFRGVRTELRVVEESGLEPGPKAVYRIR